MASRALCKHLASTLPLTTALCVESSLLKGVYSHPPLPIAFCRKLLTSCHSRSSPETLPFLSIQSSHSYKSKFRQTGSRSTTYPCKASLREVTTATTGVEDLKDANTAGWIGGFLERVRECNTDRGRLGEFLPFIVDGATLGYIHPCFARDLLQFPAVFEVEGQASGLDAEGCELWDKGGETAASGKVARGCVTLHPSLRTEPERTKAVAACLEQLRDQGLITGWRDELYPVVPSFNEPPALLLERAAATHFGIKAYGVHINGWVESPDKTLGLWVAKRSATKQTFPGKLDHIVAGGQPHGLSCAENVIKECYEEAAIPRHLAKRAEAVSVVSYEAVVKNKVKRDVLFVYDLKLPVDLVPANNDGEVESFQLKRLDEVAQVVAKSKEYKPNCALVVIDFFVRRGLVTPDERGYLELVRTLRSGDCS